LLGYPIVTWIAFLCLGVAEWVVYHDRFRVGSVLLFAGGLGTFPLGLFSMVAGEKAWRLAELHPADSVGGRRCRRCGYSLRGLAVPRCPECGCLYGFEQSIEELGIREEELHERHVDVPKDELPADRI